MTNTFINVFVMELKKFFGNKKMIISVFVIPIFLIALIICGISVIEAKETEGILKIYCSDKIYQILLNAGFDEKTEFCVSNENQKMSTDVSSLRNFVGIAIDDTEKKITIGYDSSISENTELIYLASEISEKINIELNANDYYEIYMSGMPSITFEDISSAEEQVVFSLKPLLVMISIISVMLVCMSLISLSADMVTGEKERGTFDIFRLSGSNLYSVICGKTVFLAMLGTFIFITECIVAGFCINIFNHRLFKMITDSCNNIFDLIFCVILSSAILAVFCSACFIFISSMFEKVRQASSYCSIGMLIVSLSISIPVFCDKEFVEYIPIANFTVTVMKAITNQAHVLPLIIGALISAFLSLIMLFCAAKQTERSLSL